MALYLTLPTNHLSTAVLVHMRRCDPLIRIVFKSNGYDILRFDRVVVGLVRLRAPANPVSYKKFKSLAYLNQTRVAAGQGQDPQAGPGWAFRAGLGSKCSTRP
ncbi:hypothetical protein VTN77DRAFT_4645 [Rasamsonia byssochlamydoides]|uniref:uncharacterized protein n=1 Tax=Rasamsonia byssochlamydoides TaxID=89139 RepID=UPI003742F17A